MDFYAAFWGPGIHSVFTISAEAIHISPNS